MNIYRILPGIWLILIISTSALALDLQQGMHGMTWSSSVSAMVNEEYLEQTKPDSIDPIVSEEDKSMKAAPLLD